MQKKLTMTIDEEVYEGLRKTIGPRKIGRFVQKIVRPRVVRPTSMWPTQKWLRTKAGKGSCGNELAQAFFLRTIW